MTCRCHRCDSLTSLWRRSITELEALPEHAATHPAENDSPFYCLMGNKDAEWPEFAPLEKRKLYQVPTVRGQFAFGIKAGVTGCLGS